MMMMLACLFAVQVRLALLLSSSSSACVFCVLLYNSLKWNLSLKTLLPIFNFFVWSRYIRKLQSELMMTVLVGIVFSVYLIQKGHVLVEFVNDSQRPHSLPKKECGNEFVSGLGVLRK